MNGPNPPVGGHWQNHAAGAAGHVQRNDPTGRHDPVHADPASAITDSAQHVHGEDGDSIDVQHRHDHDQNHEHEHRRGHAHDHDHRQSTRRG